MQRLRDNVEALERGARELCLEQIIEIDTQLHIMLAEFYGNREITRAIIDLRDQITTSHRAGIREIPGTRLVIGCQEHRRIARPAHKFALEHIQSGMKSVLPSRAWR